MISRVKAQKGFDNLTTAIETLEESILDVDLADEDAESIVEMLREDIRGLENQLSLYKTILDLYDKVDELEFEIAELR